MATELYIGDIYAYILKMHDITGMQTNYMTNAVGVLTHFLELR